MPPITPIQLNKRYDTNKVESIEPFGKHYFILEGAKTEKIYLKRLIESENYPIRNKIIVLLEKTCEDKDVSAPYRLLKYLIDFMESNQNDSTDDRYYIIFDRDSFKSHSTPDIEYFNFLKSAKEHRVDVLVSSPCFEFWLLLHYNDMIPIINDNIDNIFKNERISNVHTFTSKMASDRLGCNPKNKINAGIFNYLFDAIRNSKLFSTEIDTFDQKIGTNIGIYFENLIKNSLR